MSHPRRTRPESNQRSTASGAARKSHPLPKRKKFIFWCLLILGGTFAGLLLTEIAVRAFDIKPQFLRRKAVLMSVDEPSLWYFCYPSNPNGEFKPLPDVSRGNWKLINFPDNSHPLPLSDLAKTPWCVRDQFSRQGIRDRIFPVKPPEGIVRIAMVGDSFVRGEGVSVEDTLPKQLEAMLPTNRYEVMNYGFAGFDTEEEVDMVGQAVKKANAKRVILVFIPNDIHLTEELKNRQRLINDLVNVREDLLSTNQSRPWYESSQLVRFTSSMLELKKIGRETAQWYLDSYDPKFNADGLQRLANNFKTFASVPNCRIAVVLYPLIYDFENGYPLMPIHEKVKKLVQDAGLPVLDLAPAFIGSDTRSLQVHPCDHHPNRRAHAIAAREIKKWLEKDVPQFLTD